MLAAAAERTSQGICIKTVRNPAKTKPKTSAHIDMNTQPDAWP